MFERFVMFILGLLILALVVVLVVGIYGEIASDKFYLRKDQWACTASHIETQTTFIQSGNTQVPVMNNVTVCDQWTRR